MATTDSTNAERLAEQAKDSLQKATSYAEEAVRSDGHWCGELKSNVTITAEYVTLLQALGLLRDSPDKDAFAQHIVKEQNPDGSWGLAPGYKGDVSTTAEAYFALKLLGHTMETSSAMRDGQRWMTTVGGGMERVRVFTRIYLAMFGLFPWAAVPQLPAELMFMPLSSPINIYRLSSWARGTLVPLLVICHHQPIFALEQSGGSGFLDELWINPHDKMVPYGASFWSMIAKLDFIGIVFTIIDMILSFFGGLRSYNPLRRMALDSCMDWILSHQEASGDWAGIFPPMHTGVLALFIEGYAVDDSPIRLGLEALERFTWQDEDGKRMQACVSPVWDTVLMAAGLADAYPSEKQGPAVAIRNRGMAWVKDQQILNSQGDWRQYRPKLTPGGFAFEYNNMWYPDVDDTAAAIIAFLKDDRQSVSSAHVMDAVKWVLGMQCRDGGWAAFDVDNDKLFLNKIPFSDMDSLCDPSTADIVGRCLEAFGLVMLTAIETGQHRTQPMKDLLKNISKACQGGMNFLARTQEVNGAWFGRWGCNYIYGTSNVLCALAYHCFPDDEDIEVEREDTNLAYPASSMVTSMIKPALKFLIGVQNADGGWGEAFDTYRYSSVAAADSAEFKKDLSLDSTASQTAWALMGLMPYLPSNDPVIERGVQWLVSNQTVSSLNSATLGIKSLKTEKDVSRKSGNRPPSPPSSEDGEIGSAVAPLTWSSQYYTGTGFPMHFYLGYQLYSHYFPMMALGRYLQAKKQEEAGLKCNISLKQC